MKIKHFRHREHGGTEITEKEQGIVFLPASVISVLKAVRLQMQCCAAS